MRKQELPGPPARHRQRSPARSRRPPSSRACSTVPPPRAPARANFDLVGAPAFDEALVDRHAKHAELIDRVFADEELLRFIRTRVLDDIYARLTENFVVGVARGDGRPPPAATTCRGTAWSQLFQLPALQRFMAHGRAASGARGLGASIASSSWSRAHHACTASHIVERGASQMPLVQIHVHSRRLSQGSPGGVLSLQTPGYSSVGPFSGSSV